MQIRLIPDGLVVVRLGPAPIAVQAVQLSPVEMQLGPPPAIHRLLELGLDPGRHLGDLTVQVAVAKRRRS